jgi:hypothetical protein
MGKTEVLACASCGAILDLTDETMKVLSRYTQGRRTEPRIPLGTRGTLRGETFEVIGYLRKKTRIEGVTYLWSEYLLFNPYKGFRWLTEYNGHWSYFKTITGRPQERRTGGHPSAEYDGITYRHFQQSDAQVEYVVGEFYWRVAVEEKSRVSDYVAPPYILSKEIQDHKDRKEIVWSAGEYVEPGEIAAGFGLTNPLPSRIGVGPNQPSPYRPHVTSMGKLLGVLVAMALMLQLYFSTAAQHQLVYEQSFSYYPGVDEKSFVTPLFTLSGHPSNVVIRSRANVNNAWVYLSMALINDETGQAYDFGREISYYHGVEGGESWSEGNQTDEAVLPAVPSGSYYLRIEPETPGEVAYTVQVYRDVPRWRFFFMGVGLLGLPVLAVLVLSWRYERKRWMESDYPPTSSEDA